MSLDEAKTAVVNAALGVRQSGMQDVRLDALYSALAAYEAVDGAPAPPMRPPGLCSEPPCWRYAIVPGGTCFQCSDQATAERGWAVGPMEVPSE